MKLPTSRGKRLPPKKFKGKNIRTAIWKKREVDFIENEIVIKVAAGVDKESAAMEKIFSGKLKGAELIRPFDRFGMAVMQVKEGGDVIELCKGLNEIKEVEYAEPNLIDTISAVTPNDPDYGLQWHHPLINSPDAWDVETGNSGVLIAILDSGIAMSGAPPALSHPDLNDTTRFLIGPDLVNGDAYPRDDNGHGTHVAGLATAQSDNAIGVAGMSWNNRVYIVKVFDEFGAGSSTLFHDGVVEAVDYAVAHGYCCIINYSGSGPASVTKENAIIYAQAHNCLVVAAAGNDYGSPVSYPAAYSASYNNVMAVTATDSADNFAGYSNKGPEVNVAAPGTNVYSTMPNYACYLTDHWGFSQDYDYMDGTSMSTPLVSGLAALIWSYDASLAPGDIRDAIEDSAVDLGPAGWDQEFGYGRINVGAALEDMVGPEFCLYVTEVGCLMKKEACFLKLELGPCPFKQEVCVSKVEQFCKYVTEQMPCKYISEALPCSYRTEFFGGCIMITEVGCTKEICTRELPSEMCSREMVTIRPDELIIKARQPQVGKGAAIGTMKHVKPMTRAKLLAHKKRYR